MVAEELVKAAPHVAGARRRSTLPFSWLAEERRTCWSVVRWQELQAVESVAGDRRQFDGETAETCSARAGA
jgi:hypothetical protein